MTRKLLSFILAIIILFLIAYFFRNQLLVLFPNSSPKVSLVPSATPTPISLAPQTTPSPDSTNFSFIKSGKLTKNNSAKLDDIWYLTYEQPGWPPLNIKLNFNSSTNCQNCQLADLTPGILVEIKGNQEDSLSEIEVKQIRLLSQK